MSKHSESHRKADRLQQFRDLETQKHEDLALAGYISTTLIKLKCSKKANTTQNPAD